MAVAPIELPVGDRRLERVDRVLALADVTCGAQHDVHAGRRGRHRAFTGVAEVLQRAGLDRVGDRHPAELESPAELAVHDSR